jgi:hypothetical protein
MTDQQHPITPSFELMDKWWRKACRDPYYGGKLILPKTLKVIATQAARWGANEELEACLMEIRDGAGRIYIDETKLRVCLADDIWTARRPKPPTLNSIALQMLGTIERDAHYLPEITDTIRKALEQLDD